MTDFWIFSPIYDRVIVKYRVRDESGIYFFVWEKFWFNVDLIKVSKEYWEVIMMKLIG